MRIEDLKNSAWRFNERLQFLKERGRILTEEYEPIVREIIQRVREEGDLALIEYAKRFDNLEITSETMEIPYEELERAYNEIEEEVRSALEI
ncbi:MAG: histidinol dehydrogenase, partial [Aquificaceae bacterium]